MKPTAISNHLNVAADELILVTKNLKKASDNIQDDLERSKAKKNMEYFNSLLEVLDLVKQARMKIDLYKEKRNSPDDED